MTLEKAKILRGCILEIPKILKDNVRIKTTSSGSCAFDGVAFFKKNPQLCTSF